MMRFKKKLRNVRKAVLLILRLIILLINYFCIVSEREVRVTVGNIYVDFDQLAIDVGADRVCVMLIMQSVVS